MLTSWSGLSILERLEREEISLTDPELRLPLSRARWEDVVDTWKVFSFSKSTRAGLLSMPGVITCRLESELAVLLENSFRLREAESEEELAAARGGDERDTSSPGWMFSLSDSCLPG